MLDGYLPALAHDPEQNRFQSADGDGCCDMACDLTAFVAGPGR